MLIIIGEMNVIEESLNNFDIFTFISYEIIIFEIVICCAVCYIASMFAIKSQQIADIIYNHEWYELSMKHQKMIIVIVRQGQMPYMLNGLGLFDCSLETFAVVSGSFLVYFPTFEKFNFESILTFLLL